MAQRLCATKEDEVVEHTLARQGATLLAARRTLDTPTTTGRRSARLSWF
jgi:hypothetical protein